MTPVDPDQFIIARKRKKYRFALFANSPLCFELEEWTKRSVDVAEIGAGTGLFSVELAAQYPYKTFVAIDVKADRLQKGARAATERGLRNIFFVRARADQIEAVFEPASLQSIWLTFPDPFPKTGSKGRRLTNATFLRTYTKVLKPQGSLLLKHDDRPFFLWSLEQLVAHQWYIHELSFDLHESELSSDYKIITTYETRWLGEGKPTNFVQATVETVSKTHK